MFYTIVRVVNIVQISVFLQVKECFRFYCNSKMCMSTYRPTFISTLVYGVQCLIWFPSQLALASLKFYHLFDLFKLLFSFLSLPFSFIDYREEHMQEKKRDDKSARRRRRTTERERAACITHWVRLMKNLIKPCR